ncbi:transcription factor E2F3 [Parambassis ranga]|uniref:Transcription factor E2F3 n=1 Tax=Parambassis ranga TaxID=210632 RepID=A0A6P7HIN6_9TELE|nr:transcription factor E2F3-like [Parambassis ranga]
MASLTPTGGISPGKMYIGRTDTALGTLTTKFAQMLRNSDDGVLDLNVVTQELKAPKRRVYDVTNVLEGIHLIRKKSKNHIQWMGGQFQPERELKVLVEEERKLDELIRSCMQQVYQLCEDSVSQRYAYLTYEDIHSIPAFKGQTVIVIKAPAETRLEVPHPEESLQVYLRSTLGPIDVFVCSDDSSPKEDTSNSVASSVNTSCNILTTRGNDSILLPASSISKVFSKDNVSNSHGLGSSKPPPQLTQHSSSITLTPVSPNPTTFQSASDDQTFVSLSPPLAFSLDGEDYLLSLAENEGITDLFSSVDLESFSP